MVVCLVACLAGFVYGARARGGGAWIIVVGSAAAAAVVVIAWWWGMAFTLSGDYHAWNVKEGAVEKIGKRIVPGGSEGSIQERYVVTLREEGGAPFGIDDTRASLLEVGDNVSLKCKKSYEWGVPREAHGWVCRWNRPPPT